MTRLIIIIVATLLATDVYSHSGRTNSEGCHNNRKTGGYHCHISKPKTNTKLAKRSFRSNTSQPLLNKSTDGKFTCSGKTVCREMNSCAEAKFYLKECKAQSLDGDFDGIPCENICR
jgi:hypothetical protein